MPDVQNVLVIGAGACGLTAIKACLEEGLKVTCYELTNHLGGVWKYNEKDEDDVPSMFQNLFVNASKEMVAFSDFPPPKELPNYMHHSLFYRYLESYAKTYQLMEHIQFHHKVTKVVPVEDFDSSGKWKVEVSDMTSSTVREEVFDAVIVATGQHSFPFTPDLAGLEEFQGEVSHSRSYKKPDSYKDKTVLVYGLGNSGVDVATDIARISKKVYLSSRSGNWIVKRLGTNGQPSDTQTNRTALLFWSLIPRYWASAIFERRINKNIMDHKLYGLNPKHRFIDQIPRVSDTLTPYIAHGMIEMKPNIHKFTKNGVIFEGSHKEVPIDAVIVSTGYKMIFPFVSKDILDPEDRLENLYKLVFPIKLRHHTMAVIGLTVPNLLSIICVGELETRWAARVFTGKATLPSNSEMLAATEMHLSKFRSIYGQKYHHPTIICGISHMDDLASQIGAKPNMVKLLFTDVKLLWRILFGPCVPYQFRLNGANSWDGARNAILTAEDRIQYPFTKINKKSSFEIQWIRAFVALIFLLLSWYIFS